MEKTKGNKLTSDELLFTLTNFERKTFSILYKSAIALTVEDIMNNFIEEELEEKLLKNPNGHNLLKLKYYLYNIKDARKEMSKVEFLSLARKEFEVPSRPKITNALQNLQAITLVRQRTPDAFKKNIVYWFIDPEARRKISLSRNTQYTVPLD